MSRTDMPSAYSEMIMSSRPPAIRPARLGTSSGSKVPARSRGTASGTGPTPVCTVLAMAPLR
jgi:transcription elongation factor